MDKETKKTIIEPLKSGDPLITNSKITFTRLQPMTIKQLKKELGLSNKDIAKMFGFKNLASYSNSPVKSSRYENALIEFYEVVKDRPFDVKELKRVHDKTERL